MPTGFNVESGAGLSDKLKNLVPWLEGKLKATKVSITGDALCRECYREKQIKIQTSDIRAMVNNMRRAGQPIGSEADGYFYARRQEELDASILHLRERISGIGSALNGLEKARQKLPGGQSELAL